MPVTINGSSGITANDGSVFTNSSGNAGIGTSNPAAYGAKLAVAGGNIIADFDRTIGFQFAGGLNQYFKGFSGANQSSSSARGLHIFNYDNDASQGIRFWGGTNASRVEFGGFDSAGRLSTLLQPAFRVGKDNANPFSGGQVVTYNSVAFNIGNNYNTGTGVFTAPIAGRYMFAVGAVSGSGVDDLLFNIRVNGTSAVEFGTQPTLQAGQEIGGSLTAILNLSQNDAVSVFTDRALRCDNAKTNFFCGYLLG